MSTYTKAIPQSVLKVRTSILTAFVRKNKVEEAYKALRADSFPNVPLELFKAFWAVERRDEMDDHKFASKLISSLQKLQDVTQTANAKGFFWKETKATVTVSVTSPSTAPTNVVSDKKASNG
jgi:hypothetical protein